MNLLTMKTTNNEKTLKDHLKEDLRYLQLLAEQFPNIASASTEIINLEAILNLPKGTEHFLADIHGEHEAFSHVLRNASGQIRKKVYELFGQTIRDSEKEELCALIYYPKEKLELIKDQEKDINEWYTVTINHLVQVCRFCSSKYTRSKVRKSLPRNYEYIIQELLHESTINPNKSAYISVIVESIISTGRADAFIIAICQSIQRLVIDHLHIVGDIFDRGAGPHIIMDQLCEYHNVDIQWGNHDILWMGAAVGNSACIANVIRIALRYGNLNSIEDGYGINLLPLARFAMEVYKDDPCSEFMPKLSSADQAYDEKSVKLIAQMHKAIAIIQFKLEAEIIKRRKDFNMENRNLLHQIDLTAGTVTVEGKTHPMSSCNFPTIDPKHPYKLSEEEQIVIDKIKYYFTRSEKLKKHLIFLFSHGSLYLTCNMNLLYHASIPLDENGNFKKVTIEGKEYSGKELMDEVDRRIRLSYFAKDEKEKSYAIDFMWYLWCGKDSPLFDKSKMTTFERYFIKDKDTHTEVKGHYYKFRNELSTCEMILKEFGLEGSDTHIINGHVPVKAIKGEKPSRAGGKLLVIDGGFSKAYQPSTGIAGYTLIFNSQCIQLVQHKPFKSKKEAIKDSMDIKSITVVREFTSHRIMVKETDNGKKLALQVDNLKNLLDAFRLGLIKETTKGIKK